MRYPASPVLRHLAMPLVGAWLAVACAGPGVPATPERTPTSAAVRPLPPVAAPSAPTAGPTPLRVSTTGLSGNVLTPWAAFLKARNPWLVVRRHGGPGAWATFVPTYLLLITASAAGYALRGRGDVVRALARGALAGAAAAAGRGLVPAGAPARSRSA